MRVLLTGGTGFIGSRVLPLLEKHEVLCLSRDPARLPRRHGMKAVSTDLGRDGDWISEIGRFQPEWCLHLAWEGLPDYSLERCRTNLDAGLRLIGAVARSGVRRMVVAGTCAEYGRASGAVSEETVPVDRGFCAATKHAQLNVLETVARDAAFNYQWARIFFVYGPGQMQGSLIPSLHASYTSGQKASIRTPEAFRDFVHVEDVAAALVARSRYKLRSHEIDSRAAQTSHVNTARALRVPIRESDHRFGASNLWHPSRTGSALGS